MTQISLEAITSNISTAPAYDSLFSAVPLIEVRAILQSILDGGSSTYQGQGQPQPRRRKIICVPPTDIDPGDYDADLREIYSLCRLFPRDVSAMMRVGTGLIFMRGVAQTANDHCSWPLKLLSRPVEMVRLWVLRTSPISCTAQS